MRQRRSNEDRLADLFYRGQELTLLDIEQTFNVSDRHARRLLATLRERGVPIRDRREGRSKIFYVEESQQRPGSCEVNLTEQEIFALSVAANASRAVFSSTPLAQPLEDAFTQLLGNLGSNVRSIDGDGTSTHFSFAEAPSVHIDPELFTTLVRSIDECHSIRIDYLTASSGKQSHARKVDPLGIAVRGGSWFLVAWCHRRRRPTDFSIAGISRAVPCDPVEEEAFFIYPEDFDLELHFRDRFSALSGDEVYEVRLRVEPDRVPYFHRKEYHPTQQIEEHADGSATVSYEVSGLEEIRSFVQSWGIGVTVLEPEQLAERIKEEAEEVLGRYG